MFYYENPTMSASTTESKDGETFSIYTTKFEIRKICWVKLWATLLPSPFTLYVFVSQFNISFIFGIIVRYRKLLMACFV